MSQFHGMVQKKVDQIANSAQELEKALSDAQAIVDKVQSANASVLKVIEAENSLESMATDMKQEMKRITEDAEKKVFGMEKSIFEVHSMA